MKTRLLLLNIMIGMILVANAQDPTITLSFTANNNGQYVQLDSVLIENLTQGGDTMLYFPDTVLILEYASGIGESTIHKSFELNQNHPNPFTSETSINLFLSFKDRIILNVLDLKGKVLVSREDILSPGSHEFTFYPGKTQQYILTVRSNQKVQSIKMVNLNSNRSASPTLNYQGNTTIYKQSNAPNNTYGFGFNVGDELQFTAFAITEIGNIGSAIETDTPVNNSTYELNIFGGLRCTGLPTMTDIDGNIYNTVQIGDQCWMKENLKTTTFNNGSPINNVTELEDWIILTESAYVWFSNNLVWKNLYGALYNWYAVVDTNNLCPTGWHVPSNEDWTTLTDFIGGAGSPHGNELKSCRQINSPLGGECNTSDHPRWDNHDLQYGIDNFGFAGLPGGARNDNGSFGNIGYWSYWWSSTEYSSSKAWERHIAWFDGNVYVSDRKKTYGLSVRCIKD